MKKNLRKITALLSALLLTVSLASCSGSGSGSGTVSDGSGSGSQTGSQTQTKEKLKLVLTVTRINDMSFFQSAYDGSQRIKSELSDYYDVEVVEMGNDSTAWESAIYDVCESGADIVVGVSFRTVENFKKIPPEYPNIKFILMDEAVDFSTLDLPNLLCVTFKSNESGFLAGAVAGCYTSMDKANPEKLVGFVGGSEAVTVTNFLVGYAEGVHYVDPDVNVLTAYVGDYVDTAKAKDLANAQIAEGVDIIFQVAGGAGNGVIEAASESEGTLAIGVDSDQYQVMAGTSLQDCISTSSLKRVDNALFKIAEQYAKNPDSVPFGSVVTFGLEDDAVGIVYNDNLTACIGEENVAKVKELEEKIRSGEIVVSESAVLTADQIADIVAGK